MKRAESIYSELTQRGVDVILDDRNERPGVKFKDSELVGFPIRIGIGEIDQTVIDNRRQRSGRVVGNDPRDLLTMLLDDALIITRRMAAGTALIRSVGR